MNKMVNSIEILELEELINLEQELQKSLGEVVREIRRRTGRE